MTLLGHVQNGVVVFDQPVTVPDGTPVRVEPIVAAPEEPAATSKKTLAERYAGFIGMAKGLPEDLAEQHDHYIHGTPKK